MCVCGGGGGGGITVFTNITIKALQLSSTLLIMKMFLEHITIYFSIASQVEITLNNIFIKKTGTLNFNTISLCLMYFV